MNSMSLNQLKQRAGDRFSYILIGCPNFPSKTGTTTKKAFEKLIGFIDSIIARTRSDESKQWLRMCLQEINKSWKSYESGNIAEGRKLIQQAEDHFNNAVSNKRLKAKFIAGESGIALDDN